MEGEVVEVAGMAARHLISPHHKENSAARLPLPFHQGDGV